jgi:zinc transport system permease protein
MTESFILQALVGTIIGLGAGYLGSFMVLRRMSLVGDALSHVALPGIAAALLFHINPFIGAFAALFLAIVGIWALERRTNLPSETLVGIFFTSSLALGLLLTPEPELLEALFGDISKITSLDLTLAIILVFYIFFIMSRISKGLVVSIISKDLARASGVKISSDNFAFLILVAIIVALGLKIAGTLLMGSLVIIPAAAAKNISKDMKSYTSNSSILGALSALLGISLAHFYSWPPGPVVVLTSGLIFLATILAKDTSSN